jgi:topoisomerase-4 subunit A
MTAILDTPFASALSDRYLVYALSTITARSLPDVRDGLKPVHRRLLWAMRSLGLEPNFEQRRPRPGEDIPNAPDTLLPTADRRILTVTVNTTAPKKSARVVGDVIGKYHPHGDQSVYDALVRLAQDFALRYPLIEGQGNFGNVDGDGAAAMRYTEARLSAEAGQLLNGLDEDGASFRATYNGEEEEPEVMPGLFPNLLANGASGIAVGMATSVPPHNVGEVLDAAALLLERPDASTDELLALMPGPDFPTGGVLADDPATISAAYETGKGGLRLRARWRDEGGLIVIDEIPFQVPKGKLIEAIAALINDKKLPALADIRDESDAVVRIVLEPRTRAVDRDLLMESLFRLSDLETRVPVNMNVLDGGRSPRVMGLRALLQAWLDHGLDVQVRRARFRLAKIDARLETLDGLLIAFLNLDRVIKLIREADKPKAELMAAFELTGSQADAILDMRLRALNKLEGLAIEREAKRLRGERAGLAKLLASPAAQRARLKADLAEVATRFRDPRRTLLATAAPTRAISAEAFIAREPVSVIVSEKGWARALRGHVELAGADALRFKEGDGPAFAFHAYTTDRIMIAASDGRFYALLADKLPGGRGVGEPLRLMFDLAPEAAIIDVFVLDPGRRYLLAASDGRGFLAQSADLVGETRKGRAVMTPRAQAVLKCVRRVGTTADHIALVGENRRLVVIALAGVPVMSRGQGVQLQRYKDGGLGDVALFRLADGLSWAAGEGRRRTERDLAPWLGGRGQVGRMVPTGFARSGRFG